MEIMAAPPTIKPSEEEIRQRKEYPFVLNYLNATFVEHLGALNNLQSPIESLINMIS